MRSLWSIAALLLGALLPWATPVVAQDFPTRPVKIIVPQTPGGASDALARTLGQKLAEKWGQPVVIENKPGAGGNLGMEFTAHAPADGYTLLMSYVGTHAINGSLYKKLPFDPEKDFTPVATVATLPFVVVSRGNAPFRTVPELIAAASGARLTYGSAGNGSVNHLLGVLFNSAANVRLEHIPYRGAAPAMQDLMGGQIDLVFTSLPSVAGSIRQGSLRAIAVTSRKRAPLFPDIPTVAESGFADFDVTPWFGLFGPAGMPAPLVRRINADINELLKSPDLVEKFASQGAEPYPVEPQQFVTILHNDIVKWTKVVQSTGISLD